MTEPLPQTDPGASYRAQKSEIDAAIAAALASGWYILGETVSDFERAFAAWLGAGHAVGVANGTDALSLTLRALDIGAGCAVATVAHTAVATIAAIEAAGATPILLDVDRYYTMDPTQLPAAQALAQERGLRLAAVIPVHLYGQPADLDAIAAFAARENLALIEDCAQAHGARWRDKPVGRHGVAGAFSFYPTKNLGAFGDGGAATTDDAALAEKLMRLRQYGWDEARISREPGLNSRLDTLQAAILRAKLARLAANNERRRAIAAAYDKAFAPAGLRTPAIRAHATHVYHQYVLDLDDRDGVRRRLAAAGIGTAIHYSPPAHRLPAYERRLPLVGSALARTEALCARILSLPMFPEMTGEQVERAIAATLAAL